MNVSVKKGLFFGIGLGSMLGLAAQQKTTAPAKKPAATAAKPAAAKPAPAGPVLKTSLDSMSYAIGMLDGNFFKMQGISQVNASLLGRGFDDMLKSKPLMTPEQADQLIRRELQRMSRMKIQPNIEEGQKFLAECAKRPEVKQTPSGLMYEVIRDGTGPQPADTNTVKVHYDGFLSNGKKFDSSRDRGEPATFPLNQVIRGWTEGLQLMKVGGRYKLYVPYQLGYGEQGAGDAIPGGCTLVFDIELLEIVK
jgi:FKBP-type peptidyl-prolyl cis-trans isomerase FklB